MQTSIATVCLSGGLVAKLHACAEAGFDGVEVMDADIVATPESPEEIRALCARLGLRIDMFQPFRDVEGVDEDTFRSTLRRAEAKFQIMNRLGTDLMLVCSNAATATVPDDDVASDQLGRLADLAARYGVRIAYEALAWGRYVNDYMHAWRLVDMADRDNLGTCLDSFHILSRGHDPSGIEMTIPGKKIFFLQLADAPELRMDLLSWSRHYRLFPGEGAFDLVTFLGHVLRAGYRGPVSLEVFNDTFRQTSVIGTAAHARMSLSWLGAQTASVNGWTEDAVAQAQLPKGIDFVEISAKRLDAVDTVLEQLGFGFRGQHQNKPVRLWTAGDSRIILNEQTDDHVPSLTGIGLVVDDAELAFDRARALGAAPVYRRTFAGEYDLKVIAGPDGTQVSWSDRTNSWLSEFGADAETAGAPSPFERIDHVNVAYPWHDFDEAVLFNSSVIGLDTESSEDVAGPSGLVRSQVMRTKDGLVRLAMNLAPPTSPIQERHVAFHCQDAVDVARQAKKRGLTFLDVPQNYYDDLIARFDLDTDFIERLRAFNLLYDRDEHGDYIHFYTPTIGDVFFEVVERRNGYDGYSASSAPVRLQVQQRIGSVL